jgi:hypothetical protein
VLLKISVIFLLFLVLVIGLLGCNNPKESYTSQNLILRVSKVEGENFKFYKEIKNDNDVSTKMEILQNIDWEDKKVSMSRIPDYKIETVKTDPAVSYEPVTYNFWISPNKDSFEIVMEGWSKYTKLTNEQSKVVKKILES